MADRYMEAGWEGHPIEFHFVMDAHAHLAQHENFVSIGATAAAMLQCKERMGIDLIAGASQLVRLLHEHDGYSNATQADRYRMVRGDRFRGVGCARDNWWELAYSEQEEACDHEAGREVYNPCTELVNN